ncbi:MAG: hypothetical protein HYX66_04930 [Ignavibacteria bacterium]|nr:hypothetical protein [Ignavibacteria bacterium]
MLVIAQRAEAQNLAKNWYFGANAGITFLDGDPEVLTGGQINTFEGSATISRLSNGEMLFYTDGVTIWNRLHNPMPNGTGLHGDKSTSQSALILPMPGNTFSYIVVNPAPITSSNINGRCFCLKYSIVDMRREDGYGDVVVKNEILEDDITEHVTATPDCEGGGWWIIARKRNIPAFVSFHLTSAGISKIPVVSVIKNGYDIRDAGQMQTSPSGSKLVITSSSGLSLLFNVDRATGVVYDQVDLFNGTRIGTHYGASFSIDNKYVYTAVTTEYPAQGSTIYRWFVDSDDPSVILSSKESVAWFGSSEGWMPLQLGPDAKIYIGRPGTNILARFNTPSMPSPGLQDSAVVLIGEVRAGLPNFPGSMLLQFRPGDGACRKPIARIQELSTCIGECLRLVDDSKGFIDSWYWQTPGGNPSTSRERSPKICYNSAGSFPVTLIVSNLYGSDTVTTWVRVLFPPQVSVTGNSRICKGGSVKLTASGAQSYVWSPAAGLSNSTSAAPTASPLTTTKYRVIGTSAEGCFDTAFVVVTVTSPSVGPDLSVCNGDSVVLTASGAASYQWAPATGLSNPNIANPIAKPTQTTSYVVTMRVDSCVVSDTVVVTVVESVQTTLSGPAVVCSGERFVIYASGNATDYSWSGNGIIQAVGDSAVVILFSESRIRVIGKAGSCSDTSVITIKVNEASPIEVQSPNTDLCLGMSTSLYASTGTPTVLWSPSAGLSSDTGRTVIASPTVTTTYIAEARTSAGCSTFDTITISVTPSPLIDAGANLELCKGASIRLSSTGSAERYEWRPTAGLSDPFILSPIASPATTTTYTLTATNGSCTAIDSVTVFVSNLDLTLSRDTSICFGSQVELLATGAASYRWDPPDGLSDVSSSNPIAAPQVTTVYQVIGVDALGCTETKYLTVTVIDTASVRIVAGSVTANVGERSAGIPIYVDVAQELLPLRVSKLKATLIMQADLFIPQSTDRGTLVPGLRNNERRAYLTFNDLLIVTKRQKITEVRGMTLLGKDDVGTLVWEDVEWTDVVCPTPKSTPGELYITGCGLPQRMFKLFPPTNVLVLPKPSSGAIDVLISGGEPGSFIVRIVSVEGRIIREDVGIRGLAEESDILIRLNMTQAASGLYHVIVDSPTQRYAYSIAWMP